MIQQVHSGFLLSGLAPQPPVGRLPRSAALSQIPRHAAGGYITATWNWASGRALSHPWALSLPQQRLQTAHAVRDSPRGSRTSRNKPDASPPPQKADSRRPRQQMHQTQLQHKSSPSAPPMETPSHTGGLHVGQELELECARLALEGKGVCLLPPTGFVVLVERTLPGELVRAEVVSVKRGYAEARKLASLGPHRNAVPPPCPYFGPCGGCTLQSLQYEVQLEEKRNQVEQTLRRVGRLGPSLDLLAAEAASEQGFGGDRAGAEGGGGGGTKGEATLNRTVGGVAATVGCQYPYEYRNKMMFHFSSHCWVPPDKVETRACLGLLRPGTADLVLPVVRHGCKLQGAEANALLARVEELVSQQKLLPHNHPSGQGALKHLVIRSGSGPHSAGGSAEAPAGREVMLVFGVTRGSVVEQLRPVAEALGREFPQLASAVAEVVAAPKPSSRSSGATAILSAGPPQRDSRGRNSGRDSRTGRPTTPPSEDGGDALTDDTSDDGAGVGPVTLLYGMPHIHDVLGGLTFQISPGSFFQTNSRQTEVLYDVVRRAADLRPGAVDTVLDLYCGTGTIALSLAANCHRVVGVEVLESAVSDARSNAALNGITNATFLCTDVDTLQRNIAAETSTQQSSAVPAADVVIVDPARGGLSLDAAAFLSRCGARRVVYLSCNVATQARDLGRLCNGSDAPFRLVSVQPVDMFPHTDHVETVVVLDRREL